MTGTTQATTPTGTGPDVVESLAALDGRGRAVYEAVREAVSAHGYPPSMREIGAAVGLTSPSSVKHQLDKLERLGLIRRDPKRPRALEVLASPDVLAQDLTGLTGPPRTTPPSPAPGPVAVPATLSPPVPSLLAGGGELGEAVGVPLVGRIAAGSPILAEQQVEEVLPLPRRLTGEGEVFMLEVHGDSMTDAAICDGDWVVVRSQPDASQGEIVAAMVEDVDGASATVKVLSRRDGHQWLLPRNEDYAPIIGDEATILGKVVAVVRSL